MSSHRNKRLALASLFGLVVTAAAASASAQSVSLNVESREIYAQMPFVLSVSAQGFDEKPEPEAPKLEIPGCKVTFLGMSPSVFQSSFSFNGRGSQSTQITFVYRYRVEAPRPGSYDVPPVTVKQGSKSASTRPSRFSASSIATTSDMRIELTMPDRKIYIGEAFEVTLDWYLRRDPRDQNFSVPLFDSEAFTVEAPSMCRPMRARSNFRSVPRCSSFPTSRARSISKGKTSRAFASALWFELPRPGPSRSMLPGWLRA